ncbi:cysteine--tRNA ligase [Parvularcula flava]|uniref:Cysteine--tRNA ligase n=1 Tax=Aquisalinus luteolus TaxID=1566827 RepID=A0A8J3A502_9PROT|nr:cysteine--tRNA ligase [Aquisalinus luteolus]NHK28572.1 cysteine--tRNA ligase [Aquisalinus luteolus]GGH98877.1 cysteine--tRNA ligase [Aquisalinus luteolus]
MTTPTIKLHNTFTGKKEIFQPADPKRVTMYVCGPTVYSYAHIGNARAAVVFDQWFRLLRAVYGETHVAYARNFTDIDDKIIKAHQESGEPIGVITQRYADIYRDDMAGLGCLSPTHEPRATAHIAAMQGLITTLIERGHAYAAEGHVLFDVDSYDAYGKLSKLDRDEIIAGARVEVAPYKRNAADFVLWKPSADNEPGWPAPEAWGVQGKGRPGWHLECSAMIRDVFKTDTIDIHGGGQDLRFPHHENEIAQSCCSGDKGPVDGDVPLARFWLHNGFLNMGEDKMSKSLGNIVLPHDLLKEWDGEVIRWALLSAHYRQPLVWTEKILERSKRQLDRFYRVLNDTAHLERDLEDRELVLKPLQDDLNTPKAYSSLHYIRDNLVKALHENDLHKAGGWRAALLSSGKLMGFFNVDPAEWLKGKAAGEGALDDTAIDALLVERAEARKAKDFARADAIRDELAAQNILIEDGPSGGTWRRG